jgi:hypothetical protein
VQYLKKIRPINGTGCNAPLGTETQIICSIPTILPDAATGNIAAVPFIDLDKEGIEQKPM